MPNGQTPDLGFDPGPYGDDPGGGVYDDPSFAGGQKVDPATALMLRQELPGLAPEYDEVVGTPMYVSPPEEEPEGDKIPIVAVGAGVALLVGTLWYFNR